MNSLPGLDFREQLDSLYSISIEVAMLHELPQVLDRTLGYCLHLTGSEFGFVGMIDSTGLMMDVAAIKGFEPSDPSFYERFRLIPVRPNLFGVAIREGRTSISNDVLHDPRRVGQPRGHPPVRTFLGVPLWVGDNVIGMIGVANREAGYSKEEERLLSTFANQAAVAINNARLYESQLEIIQKLELLNQELEEVERERVLREERERIAADLHDRIEQAIFAVGLRINSELANAELPPRIAQSLVEIRQLAARTAEATKEVIYAMSLPGTQTGELPDIMRQLVRDLARSLALEVDLVVSGTPVPLEPTVDRALQRVAQGALLNVARHAKAKMALVSLNYPSDHVDLAVQDDGIGAPDLLLQNYAESGTHFGLKSMRRQVEGLGGTFTVSNGEEGGLVVRVRVPARRT